MAVRIIADSLAMTARSSAAVLHCRTLRIKSLSFIDMMMMALLDLHSQWQSCLFTVRAGSNAYKDTCDLQRWNGGNDEIRSKATAKRSKNGLFCPRKVTTAAPVVFVTSYPWIMLPRRSWIVDTGSLYWNLKKCVSRMIGDLLRFKLIDHPKIEAWTPYHTTFS